MSIDGLKFGHVAFKVADVEKSVGWYSEAFGAKKVYHAEAQGDRPELMFWSSSGASLSNYSRAAKHAASPADLIGYLHFCLQVDNLEQALEHLARMNVKPERKFIGRAQQRIAFISDLDGNSIELMEIPPQSAIYRT